MDSRQARCEPLAKVAIIGGGITGAATAISLLQGARTRDRMLDVRVYAGTRNPAANIVPLVLTPDCRSRLSSLGVRVQPGWRTLDIAAIEVCSGPRRERLPCPPAGLWTVDGWPQGHGGHEPVATALIATAEQMGARFIARTAQQVEVQPATQVRGLRPMPGPMPGPTPGLMVVRAQGLGDAFQAVVLATGTEDTLADRFIDGYQPPPSMPAVHARLRYTPCRSLGPQLLRLLLAPLPGVDALYLIPCATSIYALAFGPHCTPADFCQAVMAAARDGHVGEGFELTQLSTTRVPCGAGRRLSDLGRLAVGHAAFGHPFQLGISDAIASCTRASTALLDNGARAAHLERYYVQDGLTDLLTHATAASKALRWLVRAGDRAASAFAHAQARTRWLLPFCGGVLGLNAPLASTLLSSARWAAISEQVMRLFLTAVQPLPPSIPGMEPDLYYVVDDDPAAREALTQLLETHGAQVVAFADELALYCAVARRPPTAILLDVVLTWVDGLRLCEGLKQHPLTRNSRVFVMSGLSRPHIKTRALNAGAEAFLSKPLEPQMLWHVLQQHRLQPGHGPSPQDPSDHPETKRVAL